MLEEIHQHELQLVEARIELVEKMTGVNLSEEAPERQFIIETTGAKDVAEWQVEATRDGEYEMGDHDDLPICREEMKPRRLHTQSQPWEHLDEEIE